MLVVIEGPDGAGKSTLIDDLRANSSSPFFAILRGSSPPSVEGEVLWFASHAQQMAMDHLVVCDRHPLISELVYGPTLRGYSAIAPTVSMQLLEGVDLIVYCRPPWAVLQRTIRAARQMAGVPESFRTLVHQYDKLIQTVPCPVFRYDFTAPNALLELKRKLWP